MNEASFAAWLQDVAAESAEADGEVVQSTASFYSAGLTGNGFIIRLRDGEEFEVRVNQIVRKR